jgi:N-acetylglucosaminyldiphosphoundecaprenol N-acetyl-beta-D-mannosaminyltransferase
VFSGTPHYIVTTYSEFVVEANKNPKYREVLNNAHLSVPDGIGLVWAAKFLSTPKQDPILTFFNWLGSLASIVLAPQSLRTVIKGQVTGSRLIWDIAKLASEKNFTIALFGGLDGVAEKTKIKLQEKFPNLKINLAVSDQAFDEQAVGQISASNSDILLIAYQPPKQEIWIAENLGKLNVKVAIGLGGTFDYVSGKTAMASDTMHFMGLEWFWRLINQPSRIKRIWRAVAEFSWLIFKYKLSK